jgi:hypothetical protein
MSRNAPALDDTERMAAFVGTVVARRFQQRRRQFPGLPEGMIAGLAASDVWLVLDRDADPITGLNDLFALDEPS